MFSKTVTNCNLICIFTLILTLPLSISLNIDEKDFIEDGSSLQEDSDYKNVLKESRNTHVSRYRNLNPNKILKHDSSLDDSVKFKEVKKKNRIKNHAKNLKYRRSNSQNITENPLIHNMDKVLQTIDLAIRFRENVVRSLGWTLQVPGKEVLSEEQYSAIHLIYTAVREKLVDFVRLIPPFTKYLSVEAKKGQQENVEMLFKILSKNLPLYIKCTAHYIVRELSNKKIDIPGIIQRFNPLPCYYDYFTEISIEYLGKPRLTKTELIDIIVNPTTIDQSITYQTLGPIFLNIINHLNDRLISLTQEIFVSFLICMPISPLDPSLEEHIFYLYKLGKANKIPNWGTIDKTVPDKNAYNLIYTIVKRLLPVQYNNYKVIEALFYILNHLRIPQNTHMNPGFEHIKKLEEFKKDSLIKMLEAIHFPDLSDDALSARDWLLVQIKKDSFDVNLIFLRMNRYRYDNLNDLLLAILTKWQQILKPSDTEMIKSIWIVKSNLILKKLMPHAPMENPGDLHCTDLLPPTAVKEPGITILIEKPTLNKIIVVDRGECFYPKQCLKNSKGISEFPALILDEIKNMTEEKICSSQNSSFNNLCQPNNQPPQECIPKIVHVPQECPPVVCPPTESRPKDRLKCDGPVHVYVDHIGCIVIKGFDSITNPDDLRQIRELIVFLLTQRYVDVTNIWGITESRIVKPKDIYGILIIVKDIAGSRLGNNIRIKIKIFEEALPNLHVTTGIKMIQDGRTVKQMTIDLDNLLRYVINFKELSFKEQKDYISVLRYLDKNPTVLTRSKLDLFKYKNKGNLIRYIWIKLIENEEVDEDIKEKLRALLPRIRLHGPGAEKIEIKKVRTLESIRD